MSELQFTSAENVVGEEQVPAVAAKVAEQKKNKRVIVATKIQKHIRKDHHDYGKVEEDEFDEEEVEPFYNSSCDAEDNEVRESDEGASVRNIPPTRFSIMDNDTTEDPLCNVKQDVHFDACISGLYVGNQVNFTGTGMCKVHIETPNMVHFHDILHIDVKTPRTGENLIMEISVYDKFVGYKGVEPWQEYVYVKPFEKTESDDGFEHFSALFDRRAYAKKVFYSLGLDLLNKDCIVQINFVHAIRPRGGTLIESIIRPNAAAITIGENKFIMAITDTQYHFSSYNQMVILPTNKDGQKYQYKDDFNFDFDTTAVDPAFRFPKNLYVAAQHRKIKGIRQRFAIGISHLNCDKDSIPVMVILNAKTIGDMKVYETRLDVDRFRSYMQPGHILTLSASMITDMKF